MESKNGVGLHSFIYITPLQGICVVSVCMYSSKDVRIAVIIFVYGI